MRKSAAVAAPGADNATLAPVQWPHVINPNRGCLAALGLPNIRNSCTHPSKSVFNINIHSYINVTLPRQKNETVDHNFFEFALQHVLTYLTFHPLAVGCIF